MSALEDIRFWIGIDDGQPKIVQVVWKFEREDVRAARRTTLDSLEWYTSDGRALHPDTRNMLNDQFAAAYLWGRRPLEIDIEDLDDAMQEMVDEYEPTD